MSRLTPPRRRFAATALALAGLALFGAAPASAVDPGTPLQLVVTKTQESHPRTPAVVTIRVKNTGATTFEGPVRVVVRLAEGSPDLNTARRSFYGWDCTAYDYDWSSRDLPLDGTNFHECTLLHGIEAGSYSLPIEIEALTRYEAESGALQINGSDGGATTGRLTDPGVTIPHVTPDGDSVGDEYQLTWSYSTGVEDHPRGPKVTAQASSSTVPAGTEATIAFQVTSATDISTGPMNYIAQLRAGAGRFWEVDPWSEDPNVFPEPTLVLSLPSSAVELVSLVGYQPVPEQGGLTELPGARSDRTFDGFAHADEIVLDQQDFDSEGNGIYYVRLNRYSPYTRFLPNNPWRFIAKVRLKDGVSEATLSVDAIAEDNILERTEEGPIETGRAGRAIFAGPDAATASVTIRREVPAPVVPDSGGVLAQTAAPVLVGRARFATDSIRVGRTTKATVTVTNTGNSPSVAGRVCVRFTSHLVIVKKPKGVTQKGLLLCAPTPAIAVGQTITAAKGIVVRGVRTTDEARVRDGANDGVAVTGDVLEIFGQQLRAGGVTG